MQDRKKQQVVSNKAQEYQYHLRTMQEIKEGKEMHALFRIGKHPQIIDIVQPGACETLLMAAVKKGFTSVVDLLLEKKAKVNYQDSKGKTALMYVAYKHDLAMVKQLIKYNANPNPDGKFTAIDCASTPVIMSYNKKTLLYSNLKISSWLPVVAILFTYGGHVSDDFLEAVLKLLMQSDHSDYQTYESWANFLKKLNLEKISAEQYSALLIHTNNYDKVMTLSSKLAEEYLDEAICQIMPKEIRKLMLSYDTPVERIMFFNKNKKPVTRTEIAEIVKDDTLFKNKASC